MPCTQSILSNSKCWVEHMGLNQSTGLDPDGVMLRASEGLAAVDFLMPRCALNPSSALYRALCWFSAECTLTTHCVCVQSLLVASLTSGSCVQLLCVGQDH